MCSGGGIVKDIIDPGGLFMEGESVLQGAVGNKVTDPLGIGNQKTANKKAQQKESDESWAAYHEARKLAGPARVQLGQQKLAKNSGLAINKEK